MDSALVPLAHVSSTPCILRLIRVSERADIYWCLQPDLICSVLGFVGYCRSLVAPLVVCISNCVSQWREQYLIFGSSFRRHMSHHCCSSATEWNWRSFFLPAYVFALNHQSTMSVRRGFECLNQEICKCRWAGCFWPDMYTPRNRPVQIDRGIGRLSRNTHEYIVFATIQENWKGQGNVNPIRWCIPPVYITLYGHMSQVHHRLRLEPREKGLRLSIPGSIKWSQCLKSTISHSR